METKKSSFLVVENLRNYFGHISTLLGYEPESMPGALITFSGDFSDPSFNFVFTDNDILKGDHFDKVYDYVTKTKKLSATWVMEPGLKNISSRLADLSVRHISKPKKMIVNIENYVFPSVRQMPPGYSLDLIQNEEDLKNHDYVCAHCFNHKLNIAYELFKSFFKQQKDLKLQIFLLHYRGEVRGGCIMYTHGDSVGFYADAIMPPYRRAGLGSFMMQKRIEIAQQLNCKYAIAQCFPMSVSLYERFGFKNMGSLILQSQF